MERQTVCFLGHSAQSPLEEIGKPQLILNWPKRQTTYLAWVDVFRVHQMIHRAAAKVIVSKNRAARGSVWNVLLSGVNPRRTSRKVGLVLHRMFDCPDYCSNHRFFLVLFRGDIKDSGMNALQYSATPLSSTPHRKCPMAFSNSGSLVLHFQSIHSQKSAWSTPSSL